VEFERGKALTANVPEGLAKALGKQAEYTVMKELIARGLRAQLDIQSIVTGQLQIAIDFYPDMPAIYVGVDRTVQEIPTIPTSLQQLTRKLESLPIEEILNKVNLAMDGIAKLVQSPDLKESVANLNATLREVQLLVNNVDAQIRPLSAGLSEAIRDTQHLVKNADSQVASLGRSLNAAIGDGRDLIKKLDGNVDPLQASLLGMINTATADLKEAGHVLEEFKASSRADSILMHRITQSLREVEKSARSLRTLTDYLERHPEALLSGKEESGGD
jgi:paraquat-inducible protein B